MAPKRQTPSVRLRRLAGELRRLRGRAELTWEDVTERTGLNKTTLYRLETARTRPHKSTLVMLLDLYGAKTDHRAYLLQLFKDSAEQGWLRPYHLELPEEYAAYISFESEAQSVRTYQSLFIPGLLQTEDYAHALIRGTLPDIPDEAVEDRVQARMERQALLIKHKPLKFWAVVDEAALRRRVGGDTVMRGQLTRLAKANDAPNVKLQVIPYGAGAHQGMAGQFIVLDYTDPMDADLVYIESIAGDMFLETEADVGHFRSIFDSLASVALSPNDSAALLADIM
ncbi:helix-turn-helix domain-containing protein [Actinokineospora sp. 24-640]